MKLHLSGIARHVPTVLVLLGLLAVGILGHRRGWTIPSLKELLGRAEQGAGEKEDWCAAHNVPDSKCIACHPELSGSDPNDWCKEHGVPESQCTVCHPEILTKGVASDRCKEHGVPESQCTLCHPEVAVKREAPQDPSGISVSPGEAPPATKNPATCQTHAVRIQFPSKDSLRKADVLVEGVEERPMAESVRANAAIDYDQTRIAHLASRAPGTIWRVTADFGQNRWRHHGEPRVGSLADETEGCEIAAGLGVGVAAVGRPVDLQLGDVLEGVGDLLRAVLAEVEGDEAHAFPHGRGRGLELLRFLGLLLRRAGLVHLVHRRHHAPRLLAQGHGVHDGSAAVQVDLNHPLALHAGRRGQEGGQQQHSLDAHRHSLWFVGHGMEAPDPRWTANACQGYTGGSGSGRQGSGGRSSRRRSSQDAQPRAPEESSRRRKPWLSSRIGTTSPSLSEASGWAVAEAESSSGAPRRTTTAVPRAREASKGITASSRAKEVKDATAEYQSEMDLIGDFIAECCVVERGATVRSKDLRETYVKWSKEAGYDKPIHSKAFAERLVERGFTPHKGAKGARYWTGLKLADDDSIGGAGGAGGATSHIDNTFSPHKAYTETHATDATDATDQKAKPSGERCNGCSYYHCPATWKPEQAMCQRTSMFLREMEECPLSGREETQRLER